MICLYQELESNLTIVLILIFVEVSKIRLNNSSFQKIRGHAHTRTASTYISELCQCDGQEASSHPHGNSYLIEQSISKHMNIHITFW